jgi:transposase
MNEGVQRPLRLGSKQGRAQLEWLARAPWTARRRHDRLELLDQLRRQIVELSQAVEGSPAAGGAALEDASWRGRDHGAGLWVGVGHGGSFPLRQTGGQLPGTDSLRRLQPGNSVWDTSASGATRGCVTCWGGGASRGALRAQWRRRFLHLAMRRQGNIAITAVARRLAVSLYWLWRKAEDPQAAPQPGSQCGVTRLTTWRVVGPDPLIRVPRCLPEKGICSNHHDREVTIG